MQMRKREWEEIKVTPEWTLHIHYGIDGKPNPRTILEHNIDSQTCGLMKRDTKKCSRCNETVSEKIIKALPMLVNRRLLAK